MRLRILTLSTLLLSAGLAHAQTIEAGPIVNPANGNSYYRLSSSSWDQAQAFAQTLGGHLVTIQNEDENQWVFTNLVLPGNSRSWIGLRRVGPGSGVSDFSWISGDPSTYRHWNAGEPNNAGGDEFFGEMWLDGFWNDQFESDFQKSIVEVDAYAVSWFTIDDGGGTTSGGPFSINGTIGQHDAGYLPALTETPTMSFVSQTRSVGAGAGCGSQGFSAPDFGTFNKGASVSCLNGSGSASQNSTLAPTAISLVESAQAGGMGGANSNASFSVTFDLTAKASFSLNAVRECCQVSGSFTGPATNIDLGSGGTFSGNLQPGRYTLSSTAYGGGGLGGGGGMTLNFQISAAGSAYSIAGGYWGAFRECICDLNHDGLVDDADFSIFIISYNALICEDPSVPAGCPSDFNRDQLVDDADFSIFIVAYDALLCP